MNSRANKKFANGKEELELKNHRDPLIAVVSRFFFFFLRYRYFNITISFGYLLYITMVY